MHLLHPSYLWALLGLLIPIAIHLWSKKEGKTIKIGSIKLLNEEDSKQSNSISLNELLLLLLRMLLITLVVFIMAEPQIKRDSINTPITYIVEPSLLTGNAMSPLIDSLSLKSESSIRLLQDDFPELSDNLKDTENHQTPNYWQLAKHMETLHTDSIVVFTNAFSAGLKGKRPTLNKKIEWIVLNPAEPSQDILEVNLKEDHAEILSIHNNSRLLAFAKETVPLSGSQIQVNASRDSITFSQNDKKEQFYLKTETPIDLLLYYDVALGNASKYIEAAFKTISNYTDHAITISKTQDTVAMDVLKYTHVVWLSNAPSPITPSRILLFRPDALASDMIVESTKRNEFHLTKPINTESIIDNRLIEHLLSWLDIHGDLNAKIDVLDKRVLDKVELAPLYKNRQNTDKSYIETLSISKWLWIVLALVLISERIIAHLRKQ